MVNMYFSEKQLRELYENGSIEIKKLLEDNFNKKFFQKKCSKRKRKSSYGRICRHCQKK